LHTISDQQVHSDSLYDICNKKRKNSILTAPVIATLMICIVAFTGGTSQAINTVFIVISLLVALFAPKTFGYSLYAGTIVYLGYSYIQLTNYISDTLSSSTYIHYLCLAVLINCVMRGDGILKQIKAMNPVYFIFIAWFSLSRIPLSYLSAIGLFVQCFFLWKLINEVKDDSRIFRSFFYALILALFSTYLYAAIWSELLSEDLKYGFCGARDSNNFAYLCNLCIVLLQYDKEIKSKTKYILTFLLVIGVLLTVSMSGFASLMAIFIASKIFKKKRGIVTIWVYILFFTSILILVFGNTVLSTLATHSGIIGNITSRLTNIFGALKVGDYQSVTTNRTILWGYYIAQYQSMSFTQKLFGSQLIVTGLQKSYYASHSSFVDLLVGCGVLGLLIFIIMYISNLVKNLKNGDIKLAAFSFIFLVNLAFRTFSGFSLLFPIML